MSETQSFSLNPSIAIIVAGLVIAGAIVYVNQNPATAKVEGPAALPASVDVPGPREGDHVVGDINAPIVLIEYSDYECPYCSIVYPTLKRLAQQSNGQIAWVMRNFPLESIHPNARPTAVAAECVALEAGNDAFWRFSDAIFANQKDLSAATLRATALQVGATGARYDACVANDEPGTRIEADIGEAISSGGQGTPYTIIWSKNYQAPISGALEYEQFMSVITAVKARQ